MTQYPSIQNAPREILEQIFSSLAKATLRQCQFVCRSWYLTAHRLIFQEIVLKTFTTVDSFSRSLQANPHPRFLNAVQTITIGKGTGKGKLIELTKEDITQLVCKFPHLKQLHVGLAQFPLDYINDDEVCDSILKSCPEFEYISVGDPLMQSYKDVQCYHDIAYKMRHRWTKFTVRTFKQKGGRPFGEEQMLQILASLPRLKEIEIKSYFNAKGMENFLTMIGLLPPLETFKCITELDREDFVEMHLLENHLEDSRELLLRKLANIKNFTVHNNCLGRLCCNLVVFITHYLTGLESLDYTSEHRYAFDAWSDNAFCNDLLEYASRLPSYSITIPNTGRANVISFIRASRKVYRFLPQNIKHVEKHVKLHVSQPNGSFGMNIQSKKVDDYRVLRSMEIWCLNPRDYRGVIEEIVEAMDPSSPIDSLELVISKTNYTENRFPLMFFPALDAILIGLPTLEKLVISFFTVRYKNYTLPTISYPNIKHLELNVFDNCGSSITAEDIISLFTGVEYLTLHYYCGNINPETFPQNDLFLNEMELKELHLDVTLADDWVERLDKDTCVHTFFIIDVHLLVKDNHRFFKVSREGYFQISEIDEHNLEQVADGKRYFQICIEVKNLEFLKVYTYPRPYEHYVHYFHDNDAYELKEAKIWFA